MSPSHTSTVVGVGANTLSADDEDLDDICPVCDGECTCSNMPKRRPSLPNNGNALSAATTNNSSPIMPSVPTLKIKLTAGMLSKVRAAQALSNSKKIKDIEEATYEIANDGEQLTAPTSGQPGPALVTTGIGLRMPKRRGRPPKVTRDSARSAPADHLISGNEANTLSSSPLLHPIRYLKRENAQPRAKVKSKVKATKHKGKSTVVEKGNTAAATVAHRTKKKNTVLSEGDLGSELTDLDDQDIEEDYDGQSVQFPTFLSASALSTSTFSEDSDTASSDFDSDASMEAEEESYILSEERRHERARVRKELLGESSHKRKDPHNSWVIRPRKQSVGASDVGMDVDSDATDDKDDEEEEEDSGEEDELDEGHPGVTYAGDGTCWSDEDEESSFDADLFFANLSDSTGDNQSTASEEGEDVDQSDLDAQMTGPALHSSRFQMENLPFEVSQDWDGQIIFTNGLGEGQGILDLDFEVSAAQLVEDSASPSQDSDIEMQITEGEDDGEYEEMGEFGEEEQSNGGDTTDDDYVDKDGLPTKRMLELFRWPSSLSAIDPMSTVSPTVSPHPDNRKRNRRSIDSMSPRDSPRPADILAGKMFWDESDQHDRGNIIESSVASSSRGPPVMGKFDAYHGHPRKAILTGSNDNIPSPFPRLKHRKKSSSHSSSYRGRTLSRPHSLSISTSSSTLQELSAKEQTAQTSSDHLPAEAIDLHDVLDVSFLDAEATDPLPLSSTSASEGEASRRHIQILNRWDHIPMGTFRRTRESGAIISDRASTSWQAETPRVLPADDFAHGSSCMLKSSPFSEITWHSRGFNPSKGARRSPKSLKTIVISPVILPVRDGDRTPTNIPLHHSPPQNQHNHTQRKTRKEQRRETKMKRKSSGPVHHQHQHRHFQHNHHPNSKSRSTSSMQRTNFFSSPTSSVPPLNL